MNLGIVVKLPFKPFGNNGIAWLFPFIFVWKDHPELERVIGNERVHMWQWLECLIIFFPLVYLLLYIRGYLYGLKDFQRYYQNPMEVDSRMWDTALNKRPKYFWYHYTKKHIPRNSSP